MRLMNSSMRSRVPGVVATFATLLVGGAVPLFAQSATHKGGDPAAGRAIFNNRCGHCHGEDAAAEDSFYNLPQLLSDKSDAFFFRTVANGVPDKGMPSWKGVLQRREIADVLAFIRGVEKEQGITVSGQ
jgi:mono/diheme cytochrome c family protein